MKNNINVLIEDYIQKLLSAESKQDISDTLQSAASLLGFDYFAYGIKTKLPISAPKVEVVNSYSDEWNEQYLNRGLVLQDPLIGLGMKTSNFILWDDVSDDTQEFWQQAKRHDVWTGWSKPTHFPGGSASLLSFSRGESQTPVEELMANIPYLMWISSFADQGFQRFMDLEASPLKETRLTEREIETLKWSAEGKTTAEIAIILNITSRTVEFHIKNAVKKLEAANKTSAVVKAALTGLI